MKTTQDPLSVTIDALTKAERRSGSPMFAAVYAGLAKHLTQAKAEGKTLAQIADELAAAIPAKEPKDAPVALAAIRTVVESFRSGEAVTGFL